GPAEPHPAVLLLARLRRLHQLEPAFDFRWIPDQRIARSLGAARRLAAREMRQRERRERHERIGAAAREVRPAFIERRGDEEHLALAEDARSHERFGVRGANEHAAADTAGAVLLHAEQFGHGDALESVAVRRLAERAQERW